MCHYQEVQLYELTNTVIIFINNFFKQQELTQTSEEGGLTIFIINMLYL